MQDPQRKMGGLRTDKEKRKDRGTAADRSKAAEAATEGDKEGVAATTRAAEGIGANRHSGDLTKGAALTNRSQNLKHGYCPRGAYPEWSPEGGDSA